MSTVMLGFGVVVDYAVPEVPVVLDSMAGAAVIYTGADLVAR